MGAQGRTVRLFSVLSQTKSFTGHLRSSAAAPGAGKEFSHTRMLGTLLFRWVFFLTARVHVVRLKRLHLPHRKHFAEYRARFCLFPAGGASVHASQRTDVLGALTGGKGAAQFIAAAAVQLASLQGRGRSTASHSQETFVATDFFASWSVLMAASPP